ncbi:MAG TPA: aldehyde dehydrogenase family protein [Solirubrobacteraceae bacterium]|jgi:lactaldehyde dehydrogenase/glycolaldehyde dehydrogenase|nr:aldehyde dehydrogenase family protein [Solirubrobacteraceae bacterium]
MATIEHMPGTAMRNGSGSEIDTSMRVGEAWVGVDERETAPVINPSTGQAFAEVPQATEEDAQLALEAARSAQPEWAALAPGERAGYLKRVAELIHADSDRLARIISLEEGKPLRESRFEVEGWTAGFFEYFSGFARAAHGEILPSDNRGEEIEIRKVPYGVCVAVTPWNFPSAMVGRKVAPALMAGNAMVVKPSSTTPLSALALAKIFERSGIPAGIVSVLTGPGGKLGEALVRNPITQLVTLTGSVGAGEKIAAGAAVNLAAVSLELGGKAPFVVMDDADVESAARHALTARFQNNGQVCTCNERTYVHRRVYDEFIDRYVALARELTLGDPLDESTDLGPKVTEEELEKVERMVDRAREQGAEVLTGGKRAEVPGFDGGYWYEPTVISATSNDIEIMQEEIFGPVSPVMAFDSFEEALELANDSQFGLSAYLFSNDAKTVHRFIAGCEFGELYINKIGPEQLNGYHTGYRHSGVLGDDGTHGLEKYSRRRTAYLSWREDTAADLMPARAQRAQN